MEKIREMKKGNKLKAESQYQQIVDALTEEHPDGQTEWKYA
jgi:hypothetical protein